MFCFKFVYNCMYRCLNYNDIRLELNSGLHWRLLVSVALALFVEFVVLPFHHLKVWKILLVIFRFVLLNMENDATVI